MARRAPWHAIATGLAVALVHGQAVGFSFTNLDDRDFIVEDHDFLSQPASLLRVFTRSYMHVLDAQHAYYRPLVTLSYALDAQWSGISPAGYHWTNVLLHAAASLLFLAVLRRMSFDRTLAGIGAVAFAVHPAVVPAVAWIPGRNDALFSVFALSSWLLFVRGMDPAAWVSRLLHLVFFGLALATKETAVAIPVVCLAHGLLLEPGAWAGWRRRATSLGPVAGWIVGLGARWMAHPAPIGASVRDVVGNLPLVLPSLGQIVVPINPSLVSVRSDLPVWTGAGAAALAGLCVWRVRGIRSPVVAMGGAVFLLFLLPSLGAGGTLLLGSRLYLPACGAILALVEIARALVADRPTLLAFSSATAAVLAAISVTYEGSFRDRRSFARAAVAGSPHSPLAHFCLGQSYQVDGDPNRALAEYRTALELGATMGVHNNIAVLFMAQSRWSDAEGELREEVALDPRYARAHRNLAIVLRHENRLDEARDADERARELDGAGGDGPDALHRSTQR
jgi:protein O-mannosyl-transferase